MRTLSGLLALAMVAIASVALAHPMEDLLARALALASECDSVARRAQECPEGTCTERPAIEFDQAQLEAAGLELQADRQLLTVCTNCSQLDAKLADLDTALSALAVVIDGWDDQS